MKKLKLSVFTMLVLIVVVMLFRGWIYRKCITYRSIGSRQSYVAGNVLRSYTEKHSDSTHVDILNLIREGLSLTSERLEYTASRNSNDPDVLFRSKSAHCVGYAAFFASTCNCLLKMYNLDKTWTIKHRVGQIYFLNINLHRYLNTPFFKDHDFVTIENKETGEVIAVDPTINDYLLIDFVTFKK